MRSTTSGSGVTVGDLFTHHRFPNAWQLYCLIFYFPFGVVLALLRVFIAFHAAFVSALLPKTTLLRCYVLRSLCLVLGISVTEEKSEDDSGDAKVIVANHVSTLDDTAINIVRTAFSPTTMELPEWFLWSFGFVDFGAKRGRQVLINNAKTFCAESNWPLLTFPENGVTNGQRGFLAFDQWPFSLDQPVQPVLISLSRPQFTQISPTVLGSQWWSDLFWFLFVPFTHFKLRWLPVMTRLESESIEEFCRRVESEMGKVGNLQPTRFNRFDVAEHMKMMQIEEKKLRDFEGRLDSMIQQVKDCLPQVPISVIKEDLMRTRSADVSITNFLEGRVQYTPETVVAKETPKPQSSNRFDNFRETFDLRKREIIMENRRKYLARKGVVVA